MNRDPAIIIISNTATLPSTIGSMLIDPPEPEVSLVLLLVVIILLLLFINSAISGVMALLGK
jgi:hypothetical protein